MRTDIPTVPILGVRVAKLTEQAALGEVKRLFEGQQEAVVVYANAHSLNVACANPAYRRVLADAALVLNDGSGLAIAARLRGDVFPANLNGTDFTPKVLREAADRGAAVYLLGGEPGIAETAADKLTAAIPGLKIVGTQHGFSPDVEAVVGRIRASGAEVLVVAMGNPAQELWLDRYLTATGARLGIAVGAFLDFTAGKVERAPAWMRRAGVEWLYRLAREPRRLFQRYVVGNPLFLGRVLAERFGLRRNT
ncbi:WecB/TagA/CpsF family glycosyltransferase [Allokutzneria albata]|uniref:Polymer biosynthesis protein, WecB/TagA/CpsF family n=1 Tax=Allokutzneria albata TaxID=211114 RepID=A0A1H0CFQ7_ALLAB|nr:WecB/TagA/CpsF family glycosyltransferase [Allokutzneria albata]SDN56744.1 polymer biosynthesis protein, WecB/TagA/CpsF family [Allokutzneria albata]